MAASDPFPIAVKNSPRSNHRFVTFLFELSDNLNGNASFPNVDPSAANLKDTATKLAAANAKARHGTPADIADRDDQRAAAERLVDKLVVNVNATTRATAADPAAAATMILSTGLSIRKQPTRSKAPFAAKHGALSTTADLIARAIPGAMMYFWEMSSDGKSWVAAGQTTAAHTTVGNLTPGQVYMFRFRAQTRKGMGDYSAVVSLMAH